MKLVTIVIPVYKATISASECASFLQLFKVLGHHDVTVVTYKELDLTSYHCLIKEYSYRITYFDRGYFDNLAGYNRLLLSKQFYGAFRDYTYILIYQLDAWVFFDDLVKWCGRGYDYIGAPWFSSDRTENELPHFMGIGNGGFSLRKVKSHLSVLTRFAYIVRPAYFIGLFFNRLSYENFVVLLRSLTISNNTHYLLGKNNLYEDVFWGVIIRKYAWFKAPGMQEAAYFSMEVCARQLYENNGRQLPFGCHAWEKYDPVFWERFINE
ncbi:MAG TPA: DUF5672 family protein [Mucilaginibacter sp.]